MPLIRDIHTHADWNGRLLADPFILYHVPQRSGVDHAYLCERARQAYSLAPRHGARR